MNEEMTKYTLSDYEEVLAFAIDSSNPDILAVFDETNCCDEGEL